MGSGRRHELIELKDSPDQIGAEGGVDASFKKIGLGFHMWDSCVGISSCPKVLVCP